MNWPSGGALLLCFVCGIFPAAGFETIPLWRQALGGEIDTYPAQGPDGNVYVIADDRALHSIDPLTGDSQWSYRPGGRLRNLLLAAPDGTIYIQNDRQELFAVTPGGTGRWKLVMNSEAAALPAAAPDGRLLLPLTGGRIVCISRYGVILWTRDESAEASAAPVADNEGTLWLPLTDGRVIGLDTWGELIGELTGGGPASVLAMDSSGRLWVGGFSGSLMVFNLGSASRSEPIRIPSGGARIAAIFTDTDNHGHVFYQDGRMLRVAADGKVLSQERIAVSGGAPAQSENGTLFLPAIDGSIHVLEANGEKSLLRGDGVLSEPLITEEGILVAGGGDWVLYGWKAGASPGQGWKQFRGSPRRSGTFPSEPVDYDRVEARKHAGFVLRERMARSDDVSERLALLEELEEFESEKRMYRELPWVGLLLKDLAAPGTIRRSELIYPSLVSHGLVRERAYRLLGSSQDFRTKSFLQQCLRHEEDSRALAAGFRGLGELGTDWDGSSLRLIAERYRDYSPGDDQLTLAAAFALVELVRYNGGMSDRAGYSLLDNLIRNADSQGVRDKVRGIIQTMSGL